MLAERRKSLTGDLSGIKILQTACQLVGKQDVVIKAFMGQKEPHDFEFFSKVIEGLVKSLWKV